MPYQSSPGSSAGAAAAAAKLHALLASQGIPPPHIFPCALYRPFRVYPRPFIPASTHPQAVLTQASITGTGNAATAVGAGQPAGVVAGVRPTSSGASFPSTQSGAVDNPSGLPFSLPFECLPIHAAVVPAAAGVSTAAAAATAAVATTHYVRQASAMTSPGRGVGLVLDAAATPLILPFSLFHGAAATAAGFAAGGNPGPVVQRRWAFAPAFVKRSRKGGSNGSCPHCGTTAPGSTLADCDACDPSLAPQEVYAALFDLVVDLDAFKDWGEDVGLTAGWNGGGGEAARGAFFDAEVVAAAADVLAPLAAAAAGGGTGAAAGDSQAGTRLLLSWTMADLLPVLLQHLILVGLETGLGTCMATLNLIDV